MRILLVDDEVELTDPLTRLLQRQDYTVDVASDGTTGCEVTAYFTADPACTLTSGTFTEPVCTCNMDFFQVNFGACETSTNTYSANGYVEFTSPPTAGQ